jgi:lantibiotic modifying enzyme
VLYKPEFFEPLTDAPWGAARVRERITEIVDAADRSSDGNPTMLYGGASGLIWALDRLEAGGDLAGAARRALEAWRREPDYPERLDEPPIRTHASLFFGETGPLYVAWLLTQDGELADDLYARVRENEEVPGNEFMWGSVGTLRVAKAMVDRTGDERWASAWRDSARILLDRRDEEGLWTTLPWGRGLGASHGASTTANILLQGGELLDGAAEVRQTTAAALAKYAVLEDGRANWPMVAGDDLVGYDGQIRLQWCHGAAGVVASAAGYLDEDLLLAGAELCWEAGPPSLEEKGPGLCHGTAGTGYGFLKVFERTGDEKWLDRARRFAVHALEQVERQGQPRHSLWEGDIGAALFVADCLEAGPQVPIVDVL